MKNSITPNAALASETLVPIGKAGSRFPHPVGRAAIERWMRHGVRDVKLESILIGNRRFTSEEAILRFIERTSSMTRRAAFAKVRQSLPGKRRNWDSIRQREP